MNRFTNHIKISKGEYFVIIIGLVLALLVGALSVYVKSMIIPFVPVIILFIIIFLILLFREPFIGLITTLIYCFLMPVFSREIYNAIPYGIGIEILLVLTWLSVWYNADRYDFKILNNDLVILTLVWFIISLSELVNPAGANPRGWLQEIRGAALYPLLITPLGILLLNTKKRLNFFLVIIMLISFLATLNGIKQIKIGLSHGEQAFLDNGAYLTHMINGQLRVFSFYTDASQFGPSQAHIGIIALVLAIGLKGWFKKLLLLVLAFLSFYGMLISGTRGAFFVLVVGVILSILLSKNIKAIIFGGSVTLFLFFVLKYTYIGNANYNIYRLRSAIDPKDPSLNLRLLNQQRLRDYLASKPFGGGLGVIGQWGREYNPGNYLSTIAPDSYWVKVWAMYGIVGFIIFFCMWMFVLGKSSAMIWKIEDKNLKVKLIALIAGAAGIFICSYGNEVMNAMPSLILLQLSMACIYALCKQYKDKITILEVK